MQRFTSRPNHSKTFNSQIYIFLSNSVLNNFVAILVELFAKQLGDRRVKIMKKCDSPKDISLISIFIYIFAFDKPKDMAC